MGWVLPYPFIRRSSFIGQCTVAKLLCVLVTIRVGHHFVSFTDVIMSWLTLVDFLFHSYLRWSYSASVLSSPTTYDRPINMRDTTSEAGTTCPPCFSEVPVAQFIVVCNILFTIVCSIIFLLIIDLFVLWLLVSDYPLGIFICFREKYIKSSLNSASYLDFILKSTTRYDCDPNYIIKITTYQNYQQAAQTGLSDWEVDNCHHEVLDWFGVSIIILGCDYG